MKACPACGRLYPDDAGFCPVDGQQLHSATQVPVQTDDQDPRIGQLYCSRYQLRRVVADGGMGRVYEALDMQQRRNVAVKILHSDVADDDVAVERFKREFAVSKMLPHAHIVEVLDFQPTHDGTYALVMEFLYGEELRSTLKREKVIPPERVVRMLSQLAIGLAEPHAKKLVHRDLKPDNVFLCQTTDGDIAKLLDFGSVKDKGDSAKKLTVLGTTIGSPFYMAPEQAQGLDTLDHRADVWALAAITYECITGSVPFKGNNGPSILLEILTKEPPPPSVASKSQRYQVPPTVDRALASAFKKQAMTRTASVALLADAVGRAYGLEGDHTQWALTREAELGQRIAAKMTELMQATAAAPAVPNAVDNFFGESDALLADPFAAPPASTHGQVGAAVPYRAPPAPMMAASPGAWPVEGSVVPGLPKSGLLWLIPVIVGVVALILGALIVVVVAR